MQVDLGSLAKMYEAKVERWAFDSRMLALYATSASLLILPLQIALAVRSTKAKSPMDLARDNTLKYAKVRENFTMLCFRAVRFLGCLSLFALSLATALLHHSDEEGLIWGKWTRWSLTTVFVYASFLSGVSLFCHRWRPITTRHNVFLLLIVFGIYAYRDFWPLMKTSGGPDDIDEGAFLWTKLAIITFTAIIIPLFIPREYVSVDHDAPVEEPNAEQTTPLISLLLFSFLDPIIFKSSKVEHLSFEELPPLADYDHARHLREKGFQHLDTFSGAKDRHLFLRLIRVFRTQFVTLCFIVVTQVVAAFAAPIGINRVLSYLEHGPESTEIRPWFWIAWIFFGPLAFSISREMYNFISTNTAVRAESLITQLVFEHSLRIRVKAETSGSESTNNPSSSGRTTPERGTDQQAIATKKKVTRADNMIGKMNNLVTSDLNTITLARDFLLLVLYLPLQTTLGMFFLYNIVGLSAFVGLFTMVALVPLPQLITKKLASLQAEQMKRTDARVQVVSEAVSSLRMLKMFAWESKMNEKIQESRKSELVISWKIKMWETISNLLNYLIGASNMVATFAFYTVVMNQDLDASKVFSSMPVFDLLMRQLYMLTFHISRIVQAKVSLDRLDEFLRTTELLDAYAPGKDEIITPYHDENVIGFKDCIFSWATEEDGTSTPSFKLHIPGQLTFKQGCINLITGPTGSGKTSMLMALLGEMHFIPSMPQAWFNLPRSGGIAYASQESWVQNDTIRNNVLFGSPFDEDRYKKVLYQCALKQDLELFDAGDQTEVGEKGLTLSGGQKARITLARAVYSSAQVILLDDTLAALDVHTAKWIVEECLLGDLIKGRTVLLVTHNVALTEPIAHFVVSIRSDGRISTQTLEPLDHLPESLMENIEDVATDSTKDTKENAEEGIVKASGKLIVREEIAKGRVGRKAMKLFITALGGRYPFVFFPVWLLGIATGEAMVCFQTWYLGYWGSQYEKRSSEPVKASYYLSVYISLFAFNASVQCLKVLYFKFAIIRASKKIHNILMRSILGTTLRWLDETPVSRIITRCTQDIKALDGPLADAFGWVADLSIAAMIKLGSVVIISPIFIFPGMFITGVGSQIASIYLKAQLSVKREMSNAKAPVLAHFGATINALVSVRAYGAQQYFKVELLSRIDHYSRIARISWDLNRWIAIRMDLLGALFTTSLALYLVLTRSASAANTGFSLTVALDFCNYILVWVRLFNEYEVQSNSLERIQSYVEIDQEKRPTEAGKPPAAWPTSGELRVDKLSARYSTDSPEVLHKLSFQIRSGERIGVVGRTGSGKSTLTLSLLRCILTEGHVYYDGIPTDQINLEALRSSITIIPQLPELLSGTLRRNLDPFEEHDDVELNTALKYAGLFSLQSDSDDVRITLETKIASGGSNLSVGQRQIIALARAMVRESKLLILDEATSAIDYKTDTLIQDALRSKLGPDVTVITIAHRLQTIMDADKIMVLDAGNLVEYDTPAALLQKEDSLFKGLVDNSSNSDELHAIAFGKASHR